MTAALSALTQSLARPIVRGMLPYQHAQDAIALAILDDQSIVDAAAALPVWLHVLKLHVRNTECRHIEASAAIERATRRLIDLRKPAGTVRAEAHNANADHNYALTEAQVDDISAEQMTWAIRAAQKGNRHGR